MERASTKPSSGSNIHADPLEPAASKNANSNPLSCAEVATYQSEIYIEIEGKNILHQIKDDDREFGQCHFRNVMLIVDPIGAMQRAATANEQDRSIATCLVHRFETFSERQRAKAQPKKCYLIDALEGLNSRSPNDHHEAQLQDVIYSQPAEQKNLFANERICGNDLLLDFDEMFLPRRQELHEVKTLLISETWVTRRPSSAIEVWATVMPVTSASRKNIRCSHVIFLWSASTC